MAGAAESLYTLGRWLVRPGQEAAFVAAWRELGTLARCTEEPRLLYSFGPWPTLQAIEAMRIDPTATQVIRRLIDLCEVAQPGTFRLAATAGQPPRHPGQPASTLRAFARSSARPSLGAGTPLPRPQKGRLMPSRRSALGLNDKLSRSNAPYRPQRAAKLRG